MPHRHKQERSERAGSRAGEALFAAACSCGWRSEPVAASRVVVEWERHFDDVKRNAEAPDSSG